STCALSVCDTSIVPQRPGVAGVGPDIRGSSRRRGRGAVALLPRQLWVLLARAVPSFAGLLTGPPVTGRPMHLKRRRCCRFSTLRSTRHRDVSSLAAGRPAPASYQSALHSAHLSISSRSCT